MSESHFIFTGAELAVLLSAYGGETFFGFPGKQGLERGAVLSAANALTARGLLQAGNGGFQVPPGPVARLLEPLSDPEWAAFLYPRDEGEPQVCYGGKGGAVTGCETVLVQPGAVRLFRFSRETWGEELSRREALPPLAEKFPSGRAQEEEAGAPPWALGGAALLGELPAAQWLLEFWSPVRRRAVRRVALCAPPPHALIWTPEGARRTRDVYRAVQLPPWGPEEEGL